MKRYKSLFKEEHIKHDAIKGIVADVYKNPNTIKEMMPWMRGVIDPKGNLYVVDYEETRNSVIIHADLTKWLDKNTEFKSGGYTYLVDPADYLNEFLSVERQDNTNIFSLSESYEEGTYDDFKTKIDKYIQKCKSKNSWFKFKKGYSQ